MPTFKLLLLTLGGTRHYINIFSKKKITLKFFLQGQSVLNAATKFFHKQNVGIVILNTCLCDVC